MSRLCLAAFVHLVLCTLGNGKTMVPRVKWAQNKDLLFISVMVRDLKADTVSVQLDSESDLHFSAKSKAGDENVLKLPLRDDVKQESLKWEIAARPDKWGTATLITLGKGHAHRWDLLTSSKKFKGLIDKDWTREDQNLEPTEEMVLFDDVETVLRLNEKNFNKTIAAHTCLVVAARYPWCSECKSTDQVLLKASVAAKAKGRKDPEWKKVAFAYLDARENKPLARELAVTCSYSCEYLIFNGFPEEEPARIKSQYEESKLLTEIERFLGPAVREVTSSEVQDLKVSNGTSAVGYFSSKDQKEFRSFRAMAHQMRGELVFAANFDEKRSVVELWNHGEGPFTLKLLDFSANKSVLENWLRQRSLPLLQDYEWSKRETYERLQLPIAKLWYDDQSGDEQLLLSVNRTVTSVAKELLGRMAFVKQKKSMYSYELRDYGLSNPEEFPAFGIAENISWNARKFALDLAPSTPAEFWSDASLSRAKLMEFCEGVLAGNVPEAHESGMVHSNWTKGEVKRFVWKSFQELKSHQTNLLLEIYGKYRANHEVKAKEVENLAQVLQPLAEHFTVAGYDTAENYLPPEEFPRDKYASHSEWYWIPVGGSATKLSKPKKDASMKKVLQFLTSHVPELQLSVLELFAKWEAAMKENPPPETEKGGGTDDGFIRDVMPTGLEDLEAEAASEPKDDL